MGLTEKIALGMLCAFVVLGVIQLFSAPLKLALKVLLTRCSALRRCFCSIWRAV